MKLALFAAVFATACELGPPEPTTRPEPVEAPRARAPEPERVVFVAPERVVVEEKAMGTRVVLTAYTTADFDRDAVEEKLRAAHAEIARLEGLMTTWRETSEVARLNAAAGREPIAIGPETFAVLEKSVWAARISGGLFDVTFEAMKGLWKFDEGAEPRVPAKADVEKARRRIDWRKIELDPAARTARLRDEGTRINLGGIAKGYAVDAACKVLERAGLSSFFVQAGGDLFVRGAKPDGEPYRVGVRDPRSKDPGDYFALVEVRDHAFSTAGDYERAFVKNGKRYHHIIDPRTGFPGTAARSVTIWADDAHTADAIDDAVFLLGPEKGLELVESLEGVGAVIVDAANQVHVSKRLEGKVRKLKLPSEGI